MPELVELLEKAYSDGNHYYHPKIYDVSESTVAKSYITRYEAICEFEFGKELHLKGIQVPEMFSVESLGFTAPMNNHYYIWFVLMQKIKGHHIDNVSEEERDDAYRQYREQIGKVLDIGINPKDCDWGGNSLYDSEEKKLYLIDFENWSMISNPEAVKIERDRISNPYLTFRRIGT